MKKVILCFFVFLIYLIFFDFQIICADNLIMNETNYAIEENKLISLYKDNRLIQRFNNSKLLDLNKEYLLYNMEDTIILYDITNSSKLIISEKDLNLMSFEDYKEKV